MTKIGVDTSVLVGLFDPKDAWHAQAVALHTILKSTNLEAVYFDCAITEAMSTLARRLLEKRRHTEFKGLLNQIQAQFPPEVLTWILPDVPSLYARAYAQLAAFAACQRWVWALTKPQTVRRIAV